MNTDDFVLKSPKSQYVPNLNGFADNSTDLLLKCKEKVHEIDDPDSTFEVLKQLGAQE